MTVNRSQRLWVSNKQVLTVLTMACVVLIFIHQGILMVASGAIVQTDWFQQTSKDHATVVEANVKTTTTTCGYITQDDVDFKLEEHIMDGVLSIPGGGSIQCRHANNTDKRGSWPAQYPFDLQGVHLHPTLTFPNTTKTYFRRWPLKLTNTNYDFDMLPSVVCPPNVVITIIVHCVPGYFYEREMVRNTWGSVVGPWGNNWPGTEKSFPDIRLYFLIAQTRKRDDKFELKLSNEQEVHNDIIRATFIDSYHNLTLKSLMGLKFMKEHCSHVQFLLKTDDDIFLNVHQIAFLANQLIGVKDAVIGGKWLGAVVRGSSTAKWAVPYERFPFNYYPFYLAGAAYLIPKDMYGKLFDTAERVPPLHVDDAFITGIVRLILNCTLIAESRLKVDLSWDIRKQHLAFAKRDTFVTVVHTLEEGASLWNGIKRAGKLRLKRLDYD